MNEKSESSTLQVNQTANENQNDDNSNSNDEEIPAIEISDLLMEKTLLLLYQQIIKKAENLIIDSQSKLIKSFYNNDSDYITIIGCIYYLCQHPKLVDGSGFSVEQINSIYEYIEEKCGINGRVLIFTAIKRASDQNKIYNLIDLTIKNDLSSQNVKLEECQATFDGVVGVNSGKIPVFIFKINAENGFKIIKFSNRPGFSDLKCPRNILILSKYQDQNEDFENGVLLHKNFNFDYDDYGIDNHYLLEKSFDLFFFNYLFQAYWSDRSLTEDFIEINNINLPEKRISSIFHISKECEYWNNIYFCPRNKNIKQLVKKAIKNCLRLLNYIPNSIIIKYDNPLCAIDFIGDMINNDYTEKIYIIDENNQDNPIPYPLNKATLDFALLYIHKLGKTCPQIWFSITGENFYYKQHEGHEIEAKFSNPDFDQKIKSVFDPYHPSHLILFVDKNFQHRPDNVKPLSWLPNSGASDELKDEQLKIDDSSINQNILNVSSHIMNKIGDIECTSDLFFITLSNGYPVVLSGFIPDSIYGIVEFESRDNSIKRGIYHLIKHFPKKFVKNQKLIEPIPLKEITSTNHWENYPTKSEERVAILNEIKLAIAYHFHIDENNIKVLFLGKSMILLKIKGLHKNLVNHQIIDDVWNDKYQHCKADDEIKNILNGIHSINLQVTEVVHEQSIKLKIAHKKIFKILKKEFINTVHKISNYFGFLKLSISEYIETQQNDSIGYINIELIGTLACIAFASTIKEEFSNIIENNLIDEQFDVINEHFVMNYNNDLKYDKPNLFIIPSTNDAIKIQMIDSVHKNDEKEEYSTCIYLCEEQKNLPRCLYVYKYFNIFAHAICRNCILETFENMVDLQNAIDLQTRMIDRNKMINNCNDFKLLNFFVTPFDSEYKFPFGQCIWTLIECDDLISHYIKLWFTYNINVLIRNSYRYFIFCPFHKDIIYRTPENENNMICPKCKLFYHSKCHEWHYENDKCYTLKENEKRCPYCFSIVEKTGGCSHMHCKCKKHWCFKCENSQYYDCSSLVYFHMMMEHNESFFSFDRTIIHIYLNQQNEKEIVKLENETVTCKCFIPNDECLMIHDRQNGDNLQICSYDYLNLFNKSVYDLPLVIEKLYDIDMIVSVKKKESVMGDEDIKKRICKYFDYSIDSNSNV